MESPLVERRAVVRYRDRMQHAIVSARIRPGHEAAIVNVSAEGALVEATCRMLPNRTVDLQLITAAARIAVRARVLRCAVASVSAAAISYRAAVRFDAPLDWLAGRAGSYTIAVDSGAQIVAEGERTTRGGPRSCKGSLRNGR